MGMDPAEDLSGEIDRIDVSDGSAVRALAARIEAIDDATLASELCARSNAVRTAVGQLRADALAALLAREERDEFMRRASNPAYMNLVNLDAMRVPKYIAVAEHACTCGVALMVPYAKQGGPQFGFDCPVCAVPYIARIVYEDLEYRVLLEVDTRPAKKRKRRAPRTE